MYDVEMMYMLNLIHQENAMIFEMIRSMVSDDIRKITFENYDKEYERIMKSLEKYNACSDCSYKNRFEMMKDIVKEADNK